MIRIGMAVWLLLLTPLPLLWANDNLFVEQIAPILQKHCVRCHSDNQKKGDLSLSKADDLMTNEYVVPGDPDGSPLLQLVTSTDGEPPQMPKDAKPLLDEEVSQLRRWIAEGAKWPQGLIVREAPKADETWWSFQPLSSPMIDDPAADLAAKTKVIDDLIEAKLNEHNLKLNPPAERRILIRRATYDLIGLPPTPKEVTSFVADSDPRAYSKLIDRLLASPHYGERWGRHWLDVVRFGESIGYERNVMINNLWPFRDYVIRSINEDKPFDHFIREHIAGDVIEKDDPDTVIGSAFLVAGPYDDVGNQDAEQAAQIRANTLDEIIRATSEAFLGMTIGCARCHDHKFDPITQHDYYGLYATFSGIRHGSVELATPQAKAERAELLRPLIQRKTATEQATDSLRSSVLDRARKRLPEFDRQWTRPPVNRAGTEERFDPVEARFVRLVCEAQDSNVEIATGFGIDEMEIWSAAVAPIGQDTGSQSAQLNTPVNVALAANGARATGASRSIEDFPGAYGPQLAIDGETGARFIAAEDTLTIELKEPTQIDRVVFSSARDGQTPEQGTFVFVAEYRIEVSKDGISWHEVAHGRDRQPVNRDAHLDRRLLQLEMSDTELAEQDRLAGQLDAVNRELAQLPVLPTVWIGTREESDAKGPFHVFLGGNPQKTGDEVIAASLSVFRATESATRAAPRPSYQLETAAPEAKRRLALADWLTNPNNPLPPRVLANRLWHYHFGTGIVDTPSDFGFMGGKPTHPELLDYLARELLENNWRLKKMHRMIMLSRAYRQSSKFRDDGARIDHDVRLLWRFPPRRLSAEEIRDTMLQVSGNLPRIACDPARDAHDVPMPDKHQSVPDGGPGFRLYHFMQDNVCTYVPLDRHGPETYRRAVYHQNARASDVDLMSEFDQPDCTFSAPKRAATTTPLQALTMLNHHFTLDMADAMANRLRQAAESGPPSSVLESQIEAAFQLCYSRRPSDTEIRDCKHMIEAHGLTALCRILLNTSELIYVQ